MKEMQNDLDLLLLGIANIIAIFQFIAAIKWPKLARFSFFLLFAWACWMNIHTSIQSPEKYLEYADLAWSRLYRQIITGWFADHITLAVGFIAVCQGAIAVSMLLKGWIYILGSVGAIIFLLAILPFGIGSGFPSTGIAALSITILLKHVPTKFLWQKKFSGVLKGIHPKKTRSYESQTAID